MLQALVAFALVLLLAFLGLPLGFSMLSVGVGAFALSRGLEPALAMAGQQALSVSTTYGLSVLPMFLLMGAFIERANISRDLYDAGEAWVGNRRGGLAMATIFACAAFAAVCGSSVAAAAVMGKVAVPEMRRHKYAETLSLGTVAAGGTLGILIPPSVPLVIYAILTQTDVGKLFIAGILPGMLLVALYLTAIAIWARISPSASPGRIPVDWKRRWTALYRVWAMLVLFLIVFGSMYFGVCTPTEAAAIGASGALCFAIARRLLTWRNFVAALVEAGLITATLNFVLIGALTFSNYVTISDLPGALLQWIDSLHLPALGVVVVICAVYIVLGCVFEALGMLILTVPIFFPVITSLGINPIWFGIIVVIVLELGLITPPVGMNVFVVKSVVPNASMSAAFRGVAPFVVADLLCLATVLVVPAIALVLPHLMH